MKTLDEGQPINPLVRCACGSDAGVQRMEPYVWAGCDNCNVQTPALDYAQEADTTDRTILAWNRMQAAAKGYTPVAKPTSHDAIVQALRTEYLECFGHDDPTVAFPLTWDHLRGMLKAALARADGAS